MIKIFLFLLLIPQVFASNIPKDQTSLDFELEVFAIKKFDNHGFTLRSQFISQSEQSNRKELELGYRYQWNKQWRIGGSLGYYYGLRHNEDWISESGRWIWRETSSRREEVLRVFAQYKNVLFGSGKAILKNRIYFQRNMFNDQSTLIYRTGLLLFQIPKWTFLHQFDFFIPLNYNDSIMSEVWHYSGFMYRYSNRLKFGPKFSIGLMNWNQSDRFKAVTGQDFKNTLTVFRFGLGVIFSL